MSGQLYTRCRIYTRAVDGVERESGVRLYCEQADGIWALQTRSPMTLRNGREGRDFIVSTASLDRDQMAALRDAIDILLRDGEIPATYDDGRKL
jgi:hypothetical protein